MKSTSRINGFDALRTVAMWLGIVLHAIIVYKVIPEVSWPHDPGLNWNFLDWLYQYIHAFRMPLFFMVAGFFARLVMFRSGTRYFIKQRFQRIVIPFAIGVILLVPLSLFPFSFYQFYNVQHQSLNEAFSNSLNAMLSWKGLAHLWFLYYLVIFYAISILFNVIRKYIGTRFSVSHLLGSISLLHIAVAILILSVAFLINNTSSPAVYTGIMPDPVYILHYGIFYAFGWLLQTNMKSINSIATNARLLFFSGTVLSLLKFYWPEVGNSGKYPGMLLDATLISCLVFGITGLFVKYFHAENKIWRYCSDAAYWVYLVHLMIVAGMQVLLINSSVPITLRLPIVLITSMLLSVATYHLFVRYTVIGIFLHGKRTPDGRRGPIEQLIEKP